MEPYIYTKLNIYTIMSSPLPIMAAIGGASSLIDSGVAWRASVRNAHAVDEANELNYRMFREAQEYQTGEREATQQFNSDVEKRMRAEQAGFNPYMLLDGSNMSTSSTPMSSPGLPQIAPAQLNLPSFDFSQAMNLLADTLSKNEQKEGQVLSNQQQAIELKYRNTEKMLEVARLMQDNKNNAQMYKILEQQYNSLQLDNDYLDATLDERKRAVFLSNQSTELDNTNQQLTNSYQQLYNTWFPKMQAAQLQSVKAATSAALATAFAQHASGELSLEQAANAAQDYLIKELQKQGISLDNEQKAQQLQLFKESLPFMIDKAKYEAATQAKLSQTMNIGPFTVSIPADASKNWENINPYKITSNVGGVYHSYWRNMFPWSRKNNKKERSKGGGLR